ncbi:hypothetical protein [Pseudarthrobacter sp. BRE9]|uniref:hypothetical protein n=1 Tax=Pseudarthrobacter sp. BRE9 TaxID=2962582 RepID=UPI002881158C|nr:hypothetical protein [Pseudarthrobacter sp. BRE9]MDT0169131.1 hypothetical protein [Pseudarthrobacter sp. BRE9]
MQGVRSTGRGCLRPDACSNEPFAQDVRGGQNLPVPPDHLVAKSPQPVFALLLGKDRFLRASPGEQDIVEVLRVAVELANHLGVRPEEVRARDEAFVILEHALEDRSGQPEHVDERPAARLSDGL